MQNLTVLFELFENIIIITFCKRKKYAVKSEIETEQVKRFRKNLQDEEHRNVRKMTELFGMRPYEIHFSVFQKVNNTCAESEVSKEYWE